MVRLHNIKRVLFSKVISHNIIRIQSEMMKSS